MMPPVYMLYNLLGGLAAPPLLAGALVKGRLRGHWSERLGLVSFPPPEGRPRIWVHAVSVGETRVADALIRALYSLEPGVSVVMSTATDTGRRIAESTLPEAVRTTTFPLDFYGAPGRALDRVRPDLIIMLETELWPNFLRQAKKRNIRTMLANGRISLRSVAGYRRAGFLFREVLGCLDLMAMISDEDRGRIIEIGAPADRVEVAGNAKYDLLLDARDPQRRDALRGELGLESPRPVLAAGSTRRGEEVRLVGAFKRLLLEFPTLHLILAPRHVDRAAEVEDLVKAAGLTCRRRSNQTGGGPAADVTLVDRMGELFFLYGLADVAFVGGSLVPLGGQNPLEPAVWGTPVIHGPYMDDFADACALLNKAGASRTAFGPDELHGVIRTLLADRDLASRLGESGRRALAGHGGAARRLAEKALRLAPLDKRSAS